MVTNSLGEIFSERVGKVKSKHMHCISGNVFISSASNYKSGKKIRLRKEILNRFLQVILLNYTKITNKKTSKEK